MKYILLSFVLVFCLFSCDNSNKYVENETKETLKIKNNTVLNNKGVIYSNDTIKITFNKKVYFPENNYLSKILSMRHDGNTKVINCTHKIDPEDSTELWIFREEGFEPNLENNGRIGVHDTISHYLYDINLKALDSNSSNWFAALDVYEY